MSDPTQHSQTRLTPTLRALLDEAVDYAGFFPPADLSLQDALQNYLSYQQSPEAWMLGRFVVPIDLVDDLDAHRRIFKGRSPFPLCVLGTGGRTSEAFLDSLEQDIETLEAFHERHQDRARASVMEVSFPPALLEADIQTARSFMASVADRLVVAGVSKLDIFYEVPLDERASDVVPSIVAAIAEHNSMRPSPSRSVVGLKIRCGGSDPSYIPSAEQVALAIARCRDAGVRLKATAGLHHPLRHFKEPYGKMAHGFLNIFGAATLAIEHNLDSHDVQAVLRDETAKHFRFDEDTFTWNDLSVSRDDIHYARDRLATSFGSCSFEDPRDDLKELELL